MLFISTIKKSVPNYRPARYQALAWSKNHRLSSDQVGLHIVIPAYNEQSRIRPTLESIYDYFSSKQSTLETFKVVVVDDGSLDDTRTVVENFGSYKNLFLTPPRPNFGKGFSVKQGMLANTGNVALFMDADGSTHISEFEKLDNALSNGYDVAIGSRAIEGANIIIHQPFYREMMGRTFNFVAKWLAGLNFKDTQCGFKAFTKDSVLKIFKKQQIDGFAFDVEILYIAQKFGYKIAEVPINWANSPKSTVSPLYDSVRMFLDVLKVRWIHFDEYFEK